jgi:predicted DNA-binding transcriptional regulator AlpA
LDNVIDPVLPPNEAGRVLSLSTPTLGRKRRDGTGPRFVKLGERRIGYRLSDLNAWLESRVSGGEWSAAAA